MEQQETLQRKINKYVDWLQKALKDNPKSLSKMERKFATKAEANRAVAIKAEEEIKRLVDQINQAQARLRSLELQKESALGKASGYYEALATEKFEMDDEPAEPSPPEPEVVDAPVETNA